MYQRRIVTTVCAVVACAMVLSGLASCGGAATQETIKIGVIASITGNIPLVGKSTVDAANMAVQEVNDAGGLEVGGKKYKIQLLTEDDQDKKETAVSVAQKLINQSGVVAIVGPQASRNAIPAAEVAEVAHVPMISPWSTNPATTANKKYVFRAAFIDSFQGRVMARFALEELGTTKAAVLYDVASEYNRGIAEFFKQVYEEAGGQVVAFEVYTTGETDFSRQLTTIKNSGAQVIFLPNYYNEVPLQVQQARDLGIEAEFIGADGWGGMEASALPALEGAYYSTHYATDIASPVAQKFISTYQSTYGTMPDDVAALTYDAFGMLFEAIKSQGKSDPESIRNGLAAISRYEGVTGTMEYKGTGDPIKSAVILQVKDGKISFFRLAEP